MASTDASEQILELLKESPDAIATIQQVLSAFSSANITKPDPGELFSTSEDQFMTLMMGSLEHAISPRAIRPALASLVGIAWQWVVRQIRNNVTDETCAHALNLGKLAQAFSKMFFAMGRCAFPIYLTRGEADAWFDMWGIINETRMARNPRAFIPFIPL